jgi:hypothetical protein
MIPSFSIKIKMIKKKNEKRKTKSINRSYGTIANPN